MSKPITATVDMISLVLDMDDEDRPDLVREIIAACETTGIIDEIRQIANDTAYDD